MTQSATATLRIVTRGSALALWQARHVRDALAVGGAAPPELVVVRTTGDAVQGVPLSSIGDRGLFTREVDEALLDGRADIAVHSAKDVPTTLPAGLALIAFTERANPADVLVARPGAPGRLAELPAGARVGTSSLRRRAQLAAFRRDLDIVDLRGNVDTRIERVHAGIVDAAILAHAGLARLGRDAEVTDTLDPPAWLPAAGQGALALVMRADDPARERVRAALDHPVTRQAVLAERAFLRRLEGGCQVPIGALARMHGSELILYGAVFSLDGATQLREEESGSAADAEAIGDRMAATLIARGAGEILARIRADAERVPEVPEP